MYAARNTASTNMVVTRYRNPQGGAGCRASNGISACSGAACYYGPLGFARASMYSAPTPYVYIKKWPEPGQPNYDTCSAEASQTPQSYFATNPVGRWRVSVGLQIRTSA